LGGNKMIAMVEELQLNNGEREQYPAH
jgi:hypothetical protein